MAAQRKPKAIDTRNVEHTIAVRIDATLRDLEFLISLTPTGDKRSAITDVNMYCMQAQDAMKKARAL